VDNGVELRIRRHVSEIVPTPNGGFTVTLQHWEPHDYVQAVVRTGKGSLLQLALVACAAVIGIHFLLGRMGMVALPHGRYHMVAIALTWLASKMAKQYYHTQEVTKHTSMTALVSQAGTPVGQGGTPVQVQDMLVGGSGASSVLQGQVVETEHVTAQYVINCAGGAADQVAALIGDKSFKIKPRLGDYLLLNRNQVRVFYLYLL
jgi:hypothetical protein